MKFEITDKMKSDAQTFGAAFGGCCEASIEDGTVFSIEIQLEGNVLFLYYWFHSPSYFDFFYRDKYFSLYSNSPLHIQPHILKSDISREAIRVFWQGLNKLNMTEFMDVLEQEFLITGHEKIEWVL